MVYFRSPPDDACGHHSYCNGRFYIHFGDPEALKLFKKDGMYYIFHNGITEGSRRAFLMKAGCIYGDHEDGFQWMRNCQPREGYWSLSERKGFLRLKAFLPARKDRSEAAGNSLIQRMYRTKGNVVDLRMDISHMENGQFAGLLYLMGGKAAGVDLQFIESAGGKDALFILVGRDDLPDSRSGYGLTIKHIFLCGFLIK